MTAALYFHPEAYSTAGPKLMGRNAAGESFLRGFLAHSRIDAFWAQVAEPAHAQRFATVVSEHGRGEPVHTVSQANLGALRGAGAVFHPGPGMGEHAWQRAAFGHDAWSLCGITHTTSSARAMDSIVDLLTAPVHPWDALICTSTAVKANVERLLQAQVDYLQARLGIQKLVLPQLPVIPLGIHTADFAFTAAERVAAREALGAGPETVVILYTGRLSFHAKAHPLAMYQALGRAAAETGRDLLLVECGWHANDHIRDAFAAGAAHACPGVRTLTLDGRVADSRTHAWAGADIFCSLSDNIQETFGITPIEAMAAGLPVVVSDWDGYKDTVRDGIDGFRVPTLMPQAGLGGDLALRHALGTDTYDMYCGNSCMTISVDPEATVQAFVALIGSHEKRAEMGAAGRARAREVYDWATIIPQYEALWAELAALRTTHGAEAPRLTHPWPARMDPFHGFATYPTRVLTAETTLALTAADAGTAAQQVRELRDLAMVRFAPIVMPAEDELEAMLLALEPGPRQAGEVIAVVAEPRRGHALRALAWLAKLGVVRVA